MSTFDELNLSNQLQYAIDDLGFVQPTPIQEQAFSVILSGKDMVGIAQTGTGKTFAYMMPILRDLKFSKQVTPRVLVLVPTRELVLQVVEEIEKLAAYINVRVLGVYGGANINTQKRAILQGTDIIVATPGRLYDLALSKSLKMKSIQKLVIDEVDVMLDLGFRFQLINIFELLPEKRQNLMFSATMTEEVDLLISSYFSRAETIQVALSGTPLENISQTKFEVPNYYTKVNLLTHLLRDKQEMKKVLVFVSSKKTADRLFEALEEFFVSDIAVIHSNKSQNYRFKSIKKYEEGRCRVLVATDLVSRGLDLDKISHVINFDTPIYPENYMHRIGRTGRAEEEGKSILFFTEKEEKNKGYIEDLMNLTISELEIPEAVEVTQQLTEEEHKANGKNFYRNVKKVEINPAFHEKKDSNLKVNDRDKWRKERRVKYKKPQSRGDIGVNRRRK